MKVLINEDFKAIRKGEFVTALKEANEFVLTNDYDCEAIVLDEIIDANYLAISKKLNKANKLATILVKFEEKEMPQQNEKTATEKAAEELAAVKKIVEDGCNAGTSEDMILVAIVNAGIKFSNATRLHKVAMQELGLLISPTERKTQINALIKKTKFKPETYDDVVSFAASIAETVKNTTVKQASAALRSWAKVNEIKLPKKEKVKSSGGTRGARKGTKKTILVDWVLDNPGANEKDFFEKVCTMVEKPAQQKGYMSLYYLVHKCRDATLARMANTTNG